MADAPRAGGPAGHCCLHIGLPKTATKTLQMGLFAQHSQVDFLGTYTLERRQFRQCRDQEIEQLLTQLLWEGYRAPNFDQCHDLFARGVAPSLERGLVPVWSWESLMENRPEVQRQRAENLKAVFGPCRILVTLRHPLRLVESLYLQLLKRDNVGQRARIGRLPVYQPIHRWIASNWDAPGHAPKVQLEYAEAIEIYADVFGPEAIGVFLFEQLLEDPEGYFAGICRFVGVDPAEGLLHTRGKCENQRWTAPQLDRLKSVKGSLVLSTLFALAPRRERRRMLGFPATSEETCAAEGPPARVSVPAAWQERILDKTREGNQRLMRQWKLPLAAYAYPL